MLQQVPVAQVNACLLQESLDSQEELPLEASDGDTSQTTMAVPEDKDDIDGVLAQHGRAKALDVKLELPSLPPPSPALNQSDEADLANATAMVHPAWEYSCWACQLGCSFMQCKLSGTASLRGLHPAIHNCKCHYQHEVLIMLQANDGCTWLIWLAPFAQCLSDSAVSRCRPTKQAGDDTMKPLMQQARLSPPVQAPSRYQLFG